MTQEKLIEDIHHLACHMAAPVTDSPEHSFDVLSASPLKVRVVLTDAAECVTRASLRAAMGAVWPDGATIHCDPFTIKDGAFELTLYHTTLE